MESVRNWKTKSRNRTIMASNGKIVKDVLLPFMVEIEVNCMSSLENAIQFLCQEPGRIQEEVLPTDPVDLRIDYFDNENLLLLIDALETTSRKIQRLSIDTMKPSTIANQRSLDQLCNAVSCMGHLKYLQWIGNGKETPNADAMRNLTQILVNTQNLESFSCSWVKFDGTRQDFSDFSAAFSEHPTMNEVDFLECSIVDQKRTAANINPVLAALTTIPHLKTLDVECWVPPTSADMPIESFLPLSQLCGHPCLEELTLAHHILGNGPGLGAVFNALTKSTSLRSLFLSMELQEETCLQLAAMVRTNHTISDLVICVRHVQDDQHMNQVIAALGGNSTITELDFLFMECTSFSPTVQNAFVSILARDNLTLQNIQFHGIKKKPKRLQMMKFYLQLNRRRRKELFEGTNVSRDEWIMVLSKSTKSLDLLYYFLSQNPTVCDFSQISRLGEEEGRQQKRRRLEISAPFSVANISSDSDVGSDSDED